MEPGKIFDWQGALRQVLNAASVKEIETLDATSAVNRVLASPIIAAADSPEWARSTVDGYAVKSTDTETIPVSLQCVSTVTAGAVPTAALQDGQCMKMMTGAMLPDGADAVIPFENVTVEGMTIQIEHAVKHGTCCVLPGSEFQKNQEIIPKDTPITANEISIIAQLGKQQVPVYKVPTVALIITGDELVEPWVNPQPGCIRNSNAYTLLALIRQLGVSAHYLGICPDDLSVLTQKILDGLQDDLIIVVGGSAKGDKDYTKKAMENNGMTLVFDQLAIKPGGSTIFAQKGSKFSLGLPGPPGAMRTMCHLLVLPVLRKMMGYPNPIPNIYTGRFDGTFNKSTGIEFFMAAVAEFQANEFVLKPSRPRKTASWQSWKNTNAIIHIPAEIEEINSGDRVSFLTTLVIQ